MRRIEEDHIKLNQFGTRINSKTKHEIIEMTFYSYWANQKLPISLVNKVSCALWETFLLLKSSRTAIINKTIAVIILWVAFEGLYE